MRMLMDMSSVLWTGLRAGKDVEGYEVDFNGKPVHINTAAFGYENVVNHIVKELQTYDLAPTDLVMVFEGRDSKRRRCMIEPTYKAGRDKPEQAYAEFNTLKDRIKQVFRDLGAIAVSQDFVEADDVIAYLVANAEDDCIVDTGDGDLTILNGKNAYGAECLVSVSGELCKAFKEGIPYSLVTLYKSLVGDRTDNIKGCPGFGKDAFAKLQARYKDDGCLELLALIKDDKCDEVAEIAYENKCRLLDRIVDKWDETYKSYQLALLRPEWVNTVRTQLDWHPGMVQPSCADERLKHWRSQARLVTADNYDAALAFLKAKLPEHSEVGLDIETSTPDESDDWLAAQPKPAKVDPLGSTLSGFSLTFGRNRQYTYYVSVDHAQTKNISLSQSRKMFEACFGKSLLVQNTSFELSVLYQTKDEDGTPWKELWKDMGEYGFLPGVLDTLFEASYVDENRPLGLKECSLRYLEYTQQTYEETTILPGKPFPGGVTVHKKGDETAWTQYKMRELPATAVFAYGCDDTICTSALHSFYKLVMESEHTYKVALAVELDAAYLHAKGYVTGLKFSLSTMKALEAEDQETYAKAWACLRQFLIEQGWAGTVPPTFTPQITAKEIKQAYAIVKGLAYDEIEADDAEEEGEEGEAVEEVQVRDPILTSRVATPAKYVALIQAQGEELFATLLEGCLAGQVEPFAAHVLRHFSGEPILKFSPKQLHKLLYEALKLPIRVRNKPTQKMRARGVREGNAKTDALAIAYALKEATPEQAEVLESLKLIRMVRTREGLYYKPYPYHMHWKDGKIHPSHRQCGTNTRRAASAHPNMQQLPKHPKIEGQEAKFRNTIVPHKPDAVVVSIDFVAQELRVIADYSQDENLLACYVGDDLRDMHILTGLSIHNAETGEQWTYEYFVERLVAGCPIAKKYRALGKKVNFTSEYGAMAEKLGLTLLVSEDRAQMYLDAREANFPQVVKWKEGVIRDAKRTGYVTTKLGARRHLADAFNSDNRSISSKAERQAVNTKVQGSSAEMTKLAEGRMWRMGLFEKFDADYYGPVHDECVASVLIKDLPEFLPLMHGCFVANYADMQVPIKSSISFGPSFGQQVEIGEEPTAEAIAAGLVAMSEFNRSEA